ncbi:MAG: alpha/beta hydrolase [Streptosporangiaceae bacterium]|nr:alpha/beta hydrolase [Streptosporangiaceae bacterium]MBV9854982.1 alpha/beta hydrolase [Streptosporangiaceae bacterium]
MNSPPSTDDAPRQRRAYVLIPGAGGAATWYWQRVVPLLRGAGHEAIPVDLPAGDPAGLPGYARVVIGAIGGRDDVVLVAQSLGGFTAPLVATEVPVGALVFVNAMIPVPGEAAGAWWRNTGSREARVAAAQAGGYPEEFDDAVYFFHDVPAEVLPDGGPPSADSDAVFETPCDFPGWPAIPIRAVAGADDRLFPAAFQQKLSRDRLGVEADVLPGGHLMALSRPAELARYLLSV